MGFFINQTDRPKSSRNCRILKFALFCFCARWVSLVTQTDRPKSSRDFLVLNFALFSFWFACNGVSVYIRFFILGLCQILSRDGRYMWFAMIWVRSCGLSPRTPTSSYTSRTWKRHMHSHTYHSKNCTYSCTFFTFYLFIYLLSKKDTPLIYFWSANDTYSSWWHKNVPYSRRTSVYTFMMKIPPLCFFPFSVCVTDIRCSVDRGLHIKSRSLLTLTVASYICLL